MRQNEAASLGDRPLARPNSFLNMLGIGSTAFEQGNGREIEVSESKGGSSTRHLCNISLPFTGNSLLIHLGTVCLPYISYIIELK